MKIETIFDHRVAALKRLTNQYKSVAEFCREFGLDENRVRQLLTGARNFGEKSAREMEEKCGLEDFYFDAGVLGMFHHLDEEQRKEAISYIKYLSSQKN